MKKKKKRIGKVQGFALLYGRSSRAIRIVNGEEVGKVVNQHHSAKKKTGADNQMRKKSLNGAKVSAVDTLRRSSKNNSRAEKQKQKNYKMDEETKRRIDRLQDPLDMMSRNARAQKYEATNSTEKYEYGLSDW